MKTVYLVLVGLTGIVCGCSKFEDAAEKGSNYRTAPLARADIVCTVEATGTVTPRNSSSGIPVGAQVNGKLIKLFVDYNSEVTNGQVVALIDPQVYEATYKASVAKLEMNKASVARCEAELAYAEKTYARKSTLAARDMASQADLDAAIEARDTARASLANARAGVKQCEADVSQAKANLDYCTIVSPVDGIVIDRKVEEGETVVSSYNAVPVLTIAEDLKTIWIEATVPEADIGSIKIGQPVSFTADAYRRRFKGKVRQIRRAATTENNVVTFPVIVEADNPGEMLFPGMTVTLSIETARAENVVAVTSAAFRFRPKEEDLAKLDDGEIPAGPKLWFVSDDGGLRPVSVAQGVSDVSFTAVTANDGQSLEGREAVIGYQVTTAGAKDEADNPFMPKAPKHNKNKGTAPEPKK